MSSFNWQSYVNANPDLAGFTSKQAMDHFCIYGFYETRLTEFDANQYLTLNPALVAAGINESNAVDHFFIYGKDEGLKWQWNAEQYLEYNPDVAAAGFTVETAINHYLAFGEAEGRIVEFDPEAYLEANKDVAAAGFTAENALDHYLVYGKAEGRLLSFDSEVYLQMNPDVAAAGISAEKAVTHYTLYGKDEDRAYLDSEFGMGGALSQGVVLDGLIAGATFFRDANENGILDNGEMWTTTDEVGNFHLRGGKGTLMAVSGTDISTGLPTGGELAASPGSEVLSPLTSIITSLVRSGQSAAQAQSLVHKAFGVDENIDLTSFNYLEAAVSKGAESETGVDLMATGVGVQNTIVISASALSGISGGSVDIFSGHLATAQAMANIILANNGSSLDLCNAQVIEGIINAAAKILGLRAGAVATVRGAAADVASQSNATLAAIMDDGSDAVTQLTQIAQVAKVAQGEASDALNQAAQSGSAQHIQKAEDDYTGESLHEEIDKAQPGDVTGNPNAPIPEPVIVPTPAFLVHVDTDGNVTFSGTATGVIEFSVEGGNAVFTRSGQHHSVSLSNINNIELSSGQILGGSAEDLNGQHMSGDGAVMVQVTTGTAEPNLQYLGGNLTLWIQVTANVDWSSGIPDWIPTGTHIDVAGGDSLTLTDNQANGLIISGDGTVNVEIDGNIPAGLDLSHITAPMNLDVNADLDVSGMTVSKLGPVNNIDVANGVTLTMNADQANGIAVTGAGNVSITVDGPTSADLSKINPSGDVVLEVVKDAQFSGTLGSNIDSVSVDSGVTLTMDAASADGQTIGGAGTTNVVIDESFPAGLDLSGITSFLNLDVVADLDISDMTVDKLGTVDNIDVADDVTLTLNANQANNQHMTGDGTVMVQVTTGTTEPNLQYFGDNLTLWIQVAGDVDWSSGIPDWIPENAHIDVAGGDSLTLTDDLASGLVISGDGTVNVGIDGNIPAGLDLSHITATLNLDVNADLDVSGMTVGKLGTVNNIDVANGATLTINADQADGVTVTGAGNVSITVDGPTSADLSKINPSGDVVLEVVKDAQFSGTLGSNIDSLSVDSGVTLTMDAASANGQTITGVGTVDVVYDSDPTGAVDFSGISAATFNVQVKTNVDISGDTLGDNVDSFEVGANSLLTMDVTQANGMTVTGAGDVLVTNWGTTPVEDLSHISAASLVIQVNSIIFLPEDEPSPFPGNITRVEVTSGSGLGLIDEQANGQTITGQGTVSVAIIMDSTLPGDLDLSGITVETFNLSVEISSGIVDLRGAALGTGVDQIDVYEGATLIITDDQADGVTVTGGGNVSITVDGPTSADLSKINPSGNVALEVVKDAHFSGTLGSNFDSIAVDYGVTLTVDAASANGQTITGVGTTNVILGENIPADLDFGNITTTLDLDVVADLDISDMTVDVLGTVNKIEVAGNKTLTMDVTQANGMTVTGAGGVLVTDWGRTPNEDLSHISTASLVVQVDTAIYIPNEDPSPFTGNITGVDVAKDAALILGDQQANGMTITGEGVVRVDIEGPSIPANLDLSGITAETFNLTVEATSGNVDITGATLGTSLDHIEINKDATSLTMTADQADGVMVNGGSNVYITVDGPTSADLSEIKPGDNVILEVVKNTEFSGTLGSNIDSVSVDSGITLTVDADTADGQTITGAGTVNVVYDSDPTGAVDLSSISAATFNVQVKTNADISGDTLGGNVDSFEIDGSSLLTLTANQADGQAFTGSGNFMLANGESLTVTDYKSMDFSGFRGQITSDLKDNVAAFTDTATTYGKISGAIIAQVQSGDTDISGNTLNTAVTAIDINGLDVTMNAEQANMDQSNSSAGNQGGIILSEIATITNTSAEVTNYTLSAAGSGTQNSFTGSADGVGYSVAGSSIADIIDTSAGTGADNITGNGGADWISTGTGADTVHAGTGNDTITVGGHGFALLDGGDDTDTLAYDGDLDLTTMDDSKLKSIEVVDITGTGNNTLTLSATDVKAMSDNTVDGNTILTVEGDSGGYVSVDSKNWTQGDDVNVDGKTYHVFQNGDAILHLAENVDLESFVIPTSYVAAEGKPIRLDFGGNITLENADGVVLKNSSGHEVDAQVETSGSYLVITPDSDLANRGHYTVSIADGAVSDGGGTSGSGDVSVTVGYLPLDSLDGSNGFVLNDAMSEHRADSICVAGDINNRIGDINGDGVSDIIIGAPEAFVDGQEYVGKSYVIFGDKDGFDASLSLDDLDGTNGFVLNGVGEYDKSGQSVSMAGDINGDGVGDIIIGTHVSTGYDQYTAKIHVVFGDKDGFDASVNLSDVGGTVDGVVLEATTSSPYSVNAAGDINGDGVDDIIIGSPDSIAGGEHSAGKSYVLFGDKSGFDAPINLDNLDGTDGFVLNGHKENDNSGCSVSAAGDINGDGFDDLIIGADGARVGLKVNAGKSYVLFGHEYGFHSSIELKDVGGDAVDGFVINGDKALDQIGYSVSAAGDINNDGIDDLIIGSGNIPDGSTDTVEVHSYVVFGVKDWSTSPLNLNDLDGTNGFVINGEDKYDLSQCSVSAAGDMNGDGYADVIIGAPRANDEAGKSYVLFGDASGFGASVNLSDIDGTNGLVLNGHREDDNSGWSVSAAGDINHDGYDDVIVGAYGVDNNAGAAYIVYGSADYDFA